MITLEKADEYFERMKEDIVSEIEDGLNKYEYKNYFVFKTLHDVEIFEVCNNSDNNTYEAYFEGFVTEGYLINTREGAEPDECEWKVHFEVPLTEDDESNIKHVLPIDNE